jgi:hypothetical protein
MNNKTRFILLAVAAALVLVWGLGMSDGDKKSGYSDETNYYSKEELAEREKVIAQMAEMRGETPPPSATPKAEEKESRTLAEPYASIPMQDVSGKSFTLKAIGYDKDARILLAEFNMTGLIYAYFEVPEEEYIKLMESDSFDKWFEFMIMKKFSFEQLN